MNEQKPAACPACAEKRVHDVREWRDHHPLAGHGIHDGVSTLPDLIPAPVVAPKPVKPLFAPRGQ